MSDPDPTATDVVAPPDWREHRPTLTFVKGHRIDGAVYEFPHLCPGEDCAIARWLARKAEG